MSSKDQSTEHTETTLPRYINNTRRKFMKSSAVAGAAAASGVTISGAAAAAEGAEPVQETADAGYELTDRVRQYYRMARF